MLGSKNISLAALAKIIEYIKCSTSKQTYMYVVFLHFKNTKWKIIIV